MIEQTGCDYVMIGRGAMGNPFIFEQINDYLKYGVYKNYNFSDRLEIFLDYVSETSKYKIKFVNIKEQAIRFTKGTVGGSILRKRLTATKDIDELKKILVQTVSV
jgi:tRNA-dihydrouridine synthase